MGVTQHARNIQAPTALLTMGHNVPLVHATRYDSFCVFTPSSLRTVGEQQTGGSRIGSTPSNNSLCRQAVRRATVAAKI